MDIVTNTLELVIIAWILGILKDVPVIGFEMFENEKQFIVNQKIFPWEIPNDLTKNVEETP